jgi:hypothetical protein
MVYTGEHRLVGAADRSGFVSTLLYGQIFDVSFTWETVELAVREDSFDSDQFALAGTCRDTTGETHELRHGPSD